MQRPQTGVVQELEPGLRCVLAPNAGPMTHWGTNTFIIGEGDVAIVDPGPLDMGHLDALLQAVAAERVTHVIVSHAHLDHSPLARPLAQRTGASVLAFGTAEAGRRPVMQQLAEAGLSGGGEGVDTAFRPDAVLQDGDLVTGSGWALEVMHLPGHFAGHLGLKLNDALLSGDHVMDWASSLVSPPDGHIGDFMASCERLIQAAPRRLYPSHGAAIDAVEDRLRWLMTHRQSREEAIAEALATAPQSIAQITRAVYTDIDPRMLPAAERNVFAHLIDLSERNLARALPALGLDAQFQRV